MWIFRKVTLKFKKTKRRVCWRLVEKAVEQKSADAS